MDGSGAESVVIVASSEYVTLFLKSPESRRHRQPGTKYGGHLMMSHLTAGLVDVLRGVIPKLDFVSSMDLNYRETIFPVDDELPKLQDSHCEFDMFGGTEEFMSSYGRLGISFSQIKR